MEGVPWSGPCSNVASRASDRDVEMLTPQLQCDRVLSSSASVASSSRSVDDVTRSTSGDVRDSPATADASKSARFLVVKIQHISKFAINHTTFR